MDNRNRDKMSKDNEPMKESNVDRSTSQQSGSVKSGSDASFGKDIGRSENLENEPSRRTGNLGSSSGNISGDRSSNDSSSSSSSMESGWKSSSGKRSNLGEQSDVDRSSDKSYGEGEGRH